MPVQNGTDSQRLTIADVADALGISKTTVSRAISGKGRIGADTRKMVLDYIDQINYKPSPLAKGLANSKTYNICLAMPGDSTVPELPFFQRTMLGIGEAAMAEDYDVILGYIYDDNIFQLKRIVRNRKADGVILGRTLVKDESIRFLRESGIPFVVIGSTDEKGVYQIDNDHIAACTELTSILIMKGVKKLALICGSLNQVVNRTRKAGFETGLKQSGLAVREDMEFLNCADNSDIDRAVDIAIKQGAECLVCADDWICSAALAKLRKDGIRVPEDVKIASFYNSLLLENNQPSITSIKYDPKELGSEAGKMLFELINEKEVEPKKLLGYEVLLKSSTK